MTQHWDQHVNKQHIQQMAQHIWANDPDAVRREYEPTASRLLKYQHNIIDCGQALVGRRVLDMGCGNGLFSYLAMRHGAAHVMGVEPRGMYVNGLNRFAQQNGLPMEFHRGYDTDLAGLVREHAIDTVMLISVDDITHWENMMQDLRKSKVRWVIMQVTAIPDAWVQFGKEIHDHVQVGGGMPVGFTLHYEAVNNGTKAAINPMHKDTADPETGYQQSPEVIYSLKSEQYIRKFIDHAGFTVESSASQPLPITRSPGEWASSVLHQWYLLRNDQQG